MPVTHGPAWEQYAFIQHKISRLVTNAHNRVRRPCKRWDTPPFDQHRQGTIGHAKHVKALLKDACGLEVHERTVQRHLSRMGFCGLRTKNRPRSLRERGAVLQQRHDYL